MDPKLNENKFLATYDSLYCLTVAACQVKIRVNIFLLPEVDKLRPASSVQYSVVQSSTVMDAKHEWRDFCREKFYSIVIYRNSLRHIAGTH